MSEIPDDIMEVACEAHERLQQIGAIPDDTTDDAPAVYTIAAAILAERQRCADVVAHYCDSDEYSTNYRLIAADMAEAILGPQP
jgi:hypothetical protein